MSIEGGGGRTRRAGRPLSFDRQKALREAMHVFWRHGYDSTSVADLTAAMGVTPPSLYAAFGNKKALFQEAVRLYVGEPLSAVRMIEESPSAREAVRALLEASVDSFTRPDAPPGCLLASATIACRTESADLQAELAAIRGAIETALRECLERGMQNGELDVNTDAEATAAQVIATIQGLSTLARDGAGRDKLQRVAARVLSQF